MPQFTHLHVHSHYSLLDGMAKLPELLTKAKDMGMSSLALTDHGVLYGLIEFYQRALEYDMKPILGMEAYVAPNGRTMRRGNIDKNPRHITLLAQNLTGYKNLVKLSTLSHLEGFYYKPRIDYDILQKHADGIIALSGCLNGDIPKAIAENRIEDAERLIRLYIDMFGKERFFLELQDHPALPEQKMVNETLIRYGKTYGVRVVATCDVHYAHAGDDEAQDVLLCVQTRNVVHDKDRLCMMGENFSLLSPEEMAERFRDIPEAIENTQRIADMCNVELPLGKNILPSYPVPNESTPQQYLRMLCERGLEFRYGKEPQEHVKKQLDYELSIINRTGFASYFLIVQDFVNWAKKQNILVGPGRGSAAGSIVSYLLNITDMDPIRYELMFERFLNPARISMPDIDLDFADDRREEVIRYVKEKYGHDRVAQIVTFGTMAARAAIRDTGRALGFPYMLCDKIAKMIPLHSTLQDAVSHVPELRQEYEGDPQVKRLIDTAKRLEGVCRHASTHAAAVVVADRPLTEFVPLQLNDEAVVTQYAMNDVEALGLLKIDFLGLKNLTILQNTLSKIRKEYHTPIDLQTIPLDDKQTYQVLQRGDTTGVFQLESSGMKRYLKELKPTEFEDIVAMVSLYRPGPMDLIPEYIAGKHGRKQPTYLHPSLEPILKKTYGIAIYQEQVLQIARDFAGFSLGEADILRKAVGKKIASLLAEQKVKFISGAVQKGVDKKTAEKVFAFIEPFAGYGFNRSHAACYALIAYQTAYLKAHFPAAFMASLLTSDEGNTDRVAIEVAECSAMGITVLPPDVNESNEDFTVIRESGTDNIRFGLRAIKNVGDNVIASIIQTRREHGVFVDLADFFFRVHTKDLNKKSVESLAKSGAFDSLAERNHILENIDTLLSFSRAVAAQKESNQANLFGTLSGNDARPTIHLQQTTPADKRQRLMWEKELLGLFISGHPASDLSDTLDAVTTPIGEITASRVGETVQIGGIITHIQNIVTRNGQAMSFVTLEDRTKGIEVLVFPKTLETVREILGEDKVVIVQGKVNDRDGVPKILADSIQEFNPEDPPPPPLHTPTSVILRAPSRARKQTFADLKEILESAPKGHTRVILEVVREQFRVDRIRTSYSVSLTSELQARIQTILGPNAIRTEKPVAKETPIA